MKKILLPTLFLLCFYLSGISQTTLAVGDVSIIYYSANPNDEFGFVTFVDLDPGTLIYFDENGSSPTGALGTTEGVLLYTVNSTIEAGSIIPFAVATTRPYVSGNGTWSNVSGTWAPSNSGDQVFIYQDGDGPGGMSPQNNPFFIFCLQAASTDLADGCNETDSNQTDSPNTLTPVTFGGPSGSFLALGTGTGCQDENDHLFYNGSLNFPDAATAKAAITDPNNWTGESAINPSAAYTTAVDAMKASSLVLPVELNTFSGRALGKANELVWHTASEANFSHFEVQRGTDGSEFRTIGEVQGQGNTAKESAYSYTDRNFLNTQNYYRLKMVDLDGSFEYSPVILLKSNPKDGISIYPNPAKDIIRIQLNMFPDNNVFYTLMSIDGQKVMEGNINEQNYNLDIHSLNKGIYILNVSGDGSNETIKLVKE